VREAGGMVSDIDLSGKFLDSGNIIAANESMYDALGKCLER
jgi:fructose-1,6-bisphosphatase/inositol monophosphatase family enzyme